MTHTVNTLTVQFIFMYHNKHSGLIALDLYNIHTEYDNGFLGL